MNFAVTILGNNSALPAHGRHPTAQVVTYHDRLFLIDCGEGTQMQMSAYKIRRNKIQHLFISHLHGDHYFGLIGLLNSFGLQNRTRPLHIYCPEPLKKILDVQFESSDTILPFELTYTFLAPGKHQILLTQEDLVVEAFPTDHRIACFGFLFRQIQSKRKLIPRKAIEYGIPSSFYNRLQEGEDYFNKQGEKINNEWVTQDSPEGKRYAFCADTRYDERLLPYIAGCDLLYHEATYLRDEQERATGRYHSTSDQAAAIAAKARAKKLLVGHFSSKYESVLPFLQECREIFPSTELAQEGCTYLV